MILPSHIPRIKRTTKRPAKFLHAACEHRAIAQTKMLMLRITLVEFRSLGITNTPHPFTDGETLQGQVLRVLKDEVTQIEDGS